MRACLLLLLLLLASSTAQAEEPHTVYSDILEVEEGELRWSRLIGLIDANQDGIVGCKGDLAADEEKWFRLELVVTDSKVVSLRGEAPSWQLSCLEGQLKAGTLQDTPSAQVRLDLGWTPKAKVDALLAKLEGGSDLLSDAAFLEVLSAHEPWVHGEVRALAPIVIGQLDGARLHAPLSKALAGIDARWKDAGSLPGHLALRLKVATDGSIAVKSITQDDLDEPDLTAWIAKQVESCRLEAQSSVATVSYLIRFGER